MFKYFKNNFEALIELLIIIIVIFKFQLPIFKIFEHSWSNAKFQITINSQKSPINLLRSYITYLNTHSAAMQISNFHDHSFHNCEETIIDLDEKHFSRFYVINWYLRR